MCATVATCKFATNLVKVVLYVRKSTYRSPAAGHHFYFKASLNANLLQYGAQSIATSMCLLMAIIYISNIQYTGDLVYRLCATTHDNQYRHCTNIMIQLNTGIPPSSSAKVTNLSATENDHLLVMSF